MELISTVGVGGVIGLLVGLAFASWVDPNTSEGFGLLVIVCIGCGIVISALWSAIRSKK